ncbi:nucleotide exchange factor GrpE [Candidatus Microgenomates bacterium]|nr:nucleotide exchange factor GrpE [Candidatus Microgenomates bacterium]
MQKKNELKIQLARALADYDNLRKRIESDRADWSKIETAKIVLRILPVFDMLNKAQEHLKDSGLELVIQDFKSALADLGVEVIAVQVGDKFNPLLEEAVQMVEDDQVNTICEVVQPGWKMKNEDFIIRPAKVKVFGKKEELHE